MFTTLLATAAAASVLAGSGDAELVTKKKLRLSAETRNADAVTFVYGGKSFKARLVDTDRDDGEQDWSRTVTAKRKHRSDGAPVRWKVRACDGGTCATSTVRDRVEWDD